MPSAMPSRPGRLGRRVRRAWWRIQEWILERRYGFDRRFGTDTESHRPVDRLGLSDALARSAEAYAPCPGPWAAQLIELLPIDHARFAFVDLGSGKGRVLM